MKNQKTTIAGIATALAAFVLFDPQLFANFAWAVPLAKFITIGGLGSIGVLSKDSTTHSTPEEVLEAAPPATTEVATKKQAGSN